MPITLLELLDRPFPFKRLHNNGEFKSYFFEVSKEHSYIVEFSKSFNDGVWGVTFQLQGPKANSIIDPDDVFDNVGGYDNTPVSINDKSMSIVGGMPAYKVFATVKAILQDFLATARPIGIRFSSHEASRTKLYTKLAAMIKRATGWKMQKIGRYGAIEFDLRKV